MTAYLLAAGGLVALFGGGELLLRGAVGMARSLGVSRMLIGLVVVSTATSMPELVVSVGASFTGSPGIAVGNIVGSNIANMLLVFGVAGLVVPFAMARNAVRNDTLVLLLATVLAAGLAAFAGTVGRAAGIAMFAGLIAYVWLSYRAEKDSPVEREVHEDQAEEVEAVPHRPAVAALMVLGGVAVLVAGAQALVTGATSIAREIGISEGVIGLTLVALGTSLPELATSVVASVRKHPDVAVGNAVGSCIFNILGILGLTAIARPIPIQGLVSTVDLLVLVGSAAVVAAFLLSGRRFGRVPAGVFIAGYAGYVVYLFAMGGTA